MILFFVSSQYTKKVFEDFGAENVIYCPLGIDTTHFFEKPDTKYLPNDVITWCITGKMEERKQTLRTIALWTSKYGNNRNHQLIVLAFNPFMQPQQQEQMIAQALGGKYFYNIIFLSHLKTSLEVNDTLNAADIFLSYSRCEGFNLPLINALSLGKTCVALNAHVHKDYLTAQNSILVEPSGKIPAIDNIFFHQGSPFNSGNWFDCTDESIFESFVKAEQSIQIVNGKKKSIYYDEARKVVEKFNYSNTVDILLSHLK